MTTGFCTNCGAPRVEGAAFCSACGAPTGAAAPGQPAAPPPPPPQPTQYQQPGAYGVTPPPPPGGGMSRNTKIGIAVVIALVVIIALAVRQNEREFQRNRRAAQTPVATGTPSPPSTPTASSQGPAVGSEAWTRTRLIGRWSTSGCTTNTHFRIDGTTYSTNGSQSLSGTWTLDGQRLTVVEPGATTVLELVTLGDDEMTTEYQGRQQRWRRC